jgi:hypothetical protein
VSIHTELLYSLQSGDSSQVYAEAETLEAIVLAAATLREDAAIAGVPCDEFVVFRGSEYDAAATLLVQDGMAA